MARSARPALDLPPAPHPLSWAPEVAFRQIGGDVSLDFINTADWTVPGLASDRLSSFDRLIDWAVAARALSSGDAAYLRQLGAQHPQLAAAVATDARGFRHVVCSLVRTIAGADALPGLPEPAAALHHVNRVVHWAQSQLELSIAPARAERPAIRPRSRLHAPRRLVESWTWASGGDASAAPRDVLLRVLAPIAHAAARLLTSPDAALVRVCQGRDCGWAYLDRSRGRRRRWCEMETCGTAAKEERRGPRARG